MKNIEAIKEEIANIDERIEERIALYKKGLITEEILKADKIRLESARNTLMWVLK